jgi:hypothetical protein
MGVKPDLSIHIEDVRKRSWGEYLNIRVMKWQEVIISTILKILLGLPTQGRLDGQDM